MNGEVSSRPYTRSATSGATGLNLLLGLWLIISTFVLAVFNNLPNARWDNVIVGVLVILFGLARTTPNSSAGWSWLNLLLGIWLIISPFVLGFGNVRGAMWHNVILGIIIGLLALSRSFDARMAQHMPRAV